MIAIIDLAHDNSRMIDQVARMLRDGFRDNWPGAWPDFESARREVVSSLVDSRISRVALDDSGDAVGWVSGCRQYDGRVWELHPLVVRPDRQRRGIGRDLVTDFEQLVVQRGGLTVWLGSDDESGQTSLGGRDLYPDVLTHLAGIENLRQHPIEFYRKLGYVVVGVMPDANGFGKPDIFMAKRVAEWLPESTP